MPVTVAEIKDRLARWRIVDDDVIATVDVDPIAETDGGVALLDALIQADVLTSFQAEVLQDESPIPLRFGEYVLLDRIGQGGMGDVYKARHTSMQRVVALKVIRRQAEHAEAVDRFRREVVAAAKLEHSNIVAAYDAGESDGRRYLVTQFINGDNLESWVQKQGPVTLRQAVEFTLQAAEALSYAHKLGVIHRDIKPSNMLITETMDRVWILDLGLARLGEDGGIDEPRSQALTKTGVIMGTVDYMAPEQAEDTRKADARADVYSLGCTFHFLLTGRPAYVAETVVKMILQHRESAIPRLSTAMQGMPSGIDAMFAKMIAKRPDDRYQSMDELLVALRQQRSELAGTTDFVVERQPDALSSSANVETIQLQSTTGRDEKTSGPDSPTAPETSRRWPVALIGGVAVLALALVGMKWAGVFDKQGDSKVGRQAPQTLLADVIARTEGSVVKIETQGGRGNQGSGFIVAPQTIATNLHVVDNCERARVVFRDKSAATVRGVLFVDKDSDLVLLSIEKPTKQRPALKLASEMPRKGEQVIAFGSPLGFADSATEGIVSAMRTGVEINRALMVERGSLQGYGAASHWLQTTAPISSGNSGGPLVNLAGEVVGVNTWVHSRGQNLNFAAWPSSLRAALGKEAKVQPLASLKTVPGERGKADGELPASFAEKPFGEVKRLSHHSGAVHDVAVSGDGLLFATVGKDDQFCVGTLNPPQVVVRNTLAGLKPQCVAMNRDGRRIMVGMAPGGTDKFAIFLAEANGKMIARFRGRPSGTHSIKITPDEGGFASAHRKGIADFVRFAQPRDTFPMTPTGTGVDYDCWDIAFSPDSRYMATAYGNGSVIIWEVHPSMGGRSSMLVHQAGVVGIEFLGDLLVTAGGRSVKIWSHWLKPGKWKLVEEFSSGDQPVTCLATSNDGKLVASASKDRKIRVWRRGRATPHQVLSGHTDDVTSVRLLPSGKYAASASKDGTVRFWRLRPADDP